MLTLLPHVSAHVNTDTQMVVAANAWVNVEIPTTLMRFAALSALAVSAGMMI